MEGKGSLGPRKHRTLALDHLLRLSLPTLRLCLLDVPGPLVLLYIREYYRRSSDATAR